MIPLVDAALVSEAGACTARPKGMYISHVEAVQRADWIVLGKMRRRETRPTPEDRHRKEAKFAVLSVVEYLKGEGPEEVAIRTSMTDYVSDDSKDPADANFFGHSVSKFWSIGGRSYNSPDCRIHPGFLFADHLYVVFGEKQVSVGYENVVDGDMWVDFIRQMLAGDDQAELPFPKLAPAYFQDAEAIVRLTAVWSENGPVLGSQIMKGPELSYYHMLYPSPYDTMARMLDPSCFVGRRIYPGHQAETVDELVVFERLPTEPIRSGSAIDCAGSGRDGSAWAEGKGLFSRNGHRRFPVFDGKVDLGKASPIKDASGNKIRVLSLDEISMLSKASD